MAKKPTGLWVPPGTDPMNARLAEAMLRLEPRSPADLSEEELAAFWGDELVDYYNTIIVRRPAAPR
jgi:hypothetical protein